MSFVVMIKKKDFPNPLDIEVTGLELWGQFWKKQNFCFYDPKGTGPPCELRSDKKKKKKYFPYPLDIEVTGPELWHQFWKK